MGESHIDFSKKTVEMKNITKMFGSFTANEDIQLTVHQGEVHALLGENGAGKSTLMNVLYGLYTPTSGEIYINGKKVDIHNPNVAIEHGIGMVHQHFMLVEPFTVTENIILGMEPTQKGGKINFKQAQEDVRKLSQRYGLHIDPNAKIQDITVGMQQRVEIIKALYRGAEILILDEPTAVLTPQEIQDLIKIIHNLTAEGKSIIIITHKLKEIKQVADFCTIIRRGKYIGTVDVSQSTEEDLASKMVGREVTFKVEKEEATPSETVLKIEDLVVKNNRGLVAVDHLSLEIKSGEILGLAGIDGNGQTELIEAITGLRKVESGKITMSGKEITNLTPKEVINQRISTIPEDRQRRGLVLDFTVEQNTIIENYYKRPFSNKGILNYKEIKNFAKELIKEFDITL